jgi:membrane fusion protein, multidrug efflux system
MFRFFQVVMQMIKSSNHGRRACSVGRRPVFLLTVAVAALLTACDRSPRAPSAAEVSRPVEILEVGVGQVASDLRFPGRVRAVQRAELAFNVPGQLIEFPLSEGDRVEEGALIARLDPADFELRLASVEAEFDKARTDYERVRLIWEQSQAVARAEVDQKRTVMEVARSSFAAARKDLDDTRLTAPFSGVIARRYLENFENVQARQTIVSLQDGDLEIVIHVPERLVRGGARQAVGYASFQNVPGRRFPVSLKSFATEADPQTQTYQVVLAMARPEDAVVLPGMTAEVAPEVMVSDATTIRIPLKAVVADASGDPGVWVVDPESARVARRPIVVGAADSDRIVVLEGLAPGERIATAGVHQLRDGMLVRPL